MPNNQPTYESSTMDSKPRTPIERPEQTANQIIYIPTEQAYAQWASVYDTDGNFLQATDDLQLVELLPRFLTLAGIPMSSGPKDECPERRCSIIDLGCGTGRNTLKLRTLTPSPLVQILGVDSSREMLEVAERKMQSAPTDELGASLRFLQYDIAGQNPTIEGSDFQAAQAVISTLVIEHLELQEFFQSVDRLLCRDGFLLLTNMHSDMGKLSQAGFIDENGVKVRPKSIPHTIAEVCQAAEGIGFRALEVMERAIAEGDVEVLGKRSRKWVGVKCWFAIIFSRSSH